MRDVVILFGGPSSERKVSVASAQNVASVLEQAEAWFWAPDGAVHRVGRTALLAHERPFEREFTPAGIPAYPSLAHALDDPLSLHLIFFLALHGTGGEDRSEERRVGKEGSARGCACRDRRGE